MEVVLTQLNNNQRFIY